MQANDYGAWSLLPPVLALALAIATKRVLLSLLAGICVGAVLLDARPTVLAVTVCEKLLWSNLIEEAHLRVFCFTLTMGAMVGVIRQSGGMQAAVASLEPWARSRRKGQLLTWMLGLVVFIDDYASCLLVGNTMRPLSDRLRISREKLSYIVDSTAAPVSGLALVSTWIAAELGAIEEGFRHLDLDSPVDGMSVFVQSIPYRFYVIWALIMVALVAWLQRDFGPMLTAERRAWRSPPPVSDRPAEDTPTVLDNRRLWIAVAPVIITLVVTLGLLWVTGRAELHAKLGRAPALTSLAAWAQTFGNGNSNLALVYGSLCGLVSAIAWARWQQALDLDQVRDAAYQGARQVVPALAILWLAWTLSDLTDQDHLGTGSYLAGVLSKAIDVRWMPTLVFALSAIVAFSTGTSWGTMSLLMPLVIPTVYRMLAADNAQPPVNDPLLLASVAGVLSGAIFGDHCSPISDTTILSSQASGCPHIDHVRTQLPYALMVAIAAVLLGTIPVGWGVTPWLTLFVGVLVLAALLLCVGQNPEQ
jgi:Na+/H+ antiporter NhaC